MPRRSEPRLPFAFRVFSAVRKRNGLRSCDDIFRLGKFDLGFQKHDKNLLTYIFSNLIIQHLLIFVKTFYVKQRFRRQKTDAETASVGFYSNNCKRISRVLFGDYPPLRSSISNARYRAPPATFKTRWAAYMSYMRYCSG